MTDHGSDLVPYGTDQEAEPDGPAPESADAEPEAGPPSDPSGDDEPGSEEEQRRVDTERGRRAEGLSFLLGPHWYAGSGGAGRDHNASYARRDSYSHHAERDVNFHYYGVRDFDTAPRLGGLSRDDLNLRHRLHIVTDSDARLRERVRAGGATVLCGADGTGRRDSALWALSEIVPAARPASEAANQDPVEIAEVTTIGGLFPEASGERAPGRSSGWRTVPQCGYVLDASGLTDRINQLHLDALNRSAAPDAWLIVLASESALAEDLRGSPDVVKHKGPVLAKVLENHLWARLEHATPGTEEQTRKLLESTGLRDEVARLIHPAEAVRLSGDLATQLLAHASADDIITFLPGRRREELREKFHIAPPPHRALPLVAAAVFQGRPAGTVVRAAERLVWLSSERPDPFAAVLPNELNAFVAGFPSVDEPEAQRGDDPRVTLKPESLGRDLLTMVWRDRPGLRPILLDWLGELAEDDDPAMRIQAAQGVGMFAVLDFEYVANAMLHRWRISPRRPHRQAFRWALEAAAGADERSAERVRRLLRAGGGSIQTRSTVIDAYGTRIGALFPDDALRAIDGLLRETARRADIAQHVRVMDTVQVVLGDRYAKIRAAIDPHRIAAIITEIFASGATRQVLRDLYDWIHVPEQGRDTAEALAKRMVVAHMMVRVARLPAAETSTPRPPALLRMLSTEETTAELLRPIWRAALDDRFVGKRAWDVLRGWVQAADDDVALVDPLRALIVPMTEESPLERRRFYHQIQQWKRRRGDASFHAFPRI